MEKALAAYIAEYTNRILSPESASLGGNMKMSLLVFSICKNAVSTFMQKLALS